MLVFVYFDLEVCAHLFIRTMYMAFEKQSKVPYACGPLFLKSRLDQCKLYLNLAML